ncbi:hypothetical protein JCM21900_003503 [Sporobolomyces salmonicolor]
MSSSLPSPAPSRPLSPTAAADSTPRPVLWLPSRIHPVAARLATSLFDVITHEDPRANEWWDHADASVVRTGSITEEDLHRAKKLRIVARNGVGCDSIALEACKEAGIVVTNQPGANAKAVAELALGLTISIARRVVEFDRRLRRGEILPSIDWLAGTVEDKTVGLVGMGDIAREVAKKFHGAFDAPILVYSPTSSPLKWTDQDPSGLPPVPHRRVSSLRELLTQSDIVSLHCPLVPSTFGMMGEAEFKLMKRDAILINTARGGLIDEGALLDALKTREIYGAGLDVVVHEPASAATYGELLSLENVVVLPHAGAGTEKVQAEGCVRALLTCESFLKGEGVGNSNRVV